MQILLSLQYIKFSFFFVSLIYWSWFEFYIFIIIVVVEILDLLINFLYVSRNNRSKFEICLLYIILERERREEKKSEAKPFNLFNWNII